MSAVDGMLQIMTESAARSLRLAAGSPARMLDASGQARDASSSPLTRQEILQLITPIVPEQARRRLPQERSVDFDYTSPSGPFKVTILRNETEIVVSFVPDADAVVAPPPSPAQLWLRSCRAVRLPAFRLPASRHSAPQLPAPPHPSHPLLTRRHRHRSTVPRDGRKQSLGSASVDRHAAAGSQGRPHPAARRGRAGHDPRRHRGAAGCDHAGDQSRRVRATQRHRLRLRDQGPGALPRQHVSRSQGPRRRVPRHPREDPERRGSRALAVHPQAVQADQGARARHRTHRIGQVDHAVRDDRLHQSHAHRSHHHHRGPDRVRAREQGLPDQPARGRHAHRRIQARAARGDARGPRHHPGRRAARPRDGGDRDRDGGDRPPRVRHAAHHDGRVDGRSRDRSVSRPSSSRRSASCCRNH